MKRYILTFSILILIIIAASVSLLFYDKPILRETSSVNRLNPIRISYENLDRSVDLTKRVYFFCNEASINCQYVNNDILEPIINSAGVERFDHFFFVDAGILERDILPSAIKTRLGFETMPAFVILSKSNNRIVYHSVLEWKDTNPITMAILKNWMLENKLWLENFED